MHLMSSGSFHARFKEIGEFGQPLFDAAGHPLLIRARAVPRQIQLLDHAVHRLWSRVLGAVPQSFKNRSEDLRDPAVVLLYRVVAELLRDGDMIPPLVLG